MTAVFDVSQVDALPAPAVVVELDVPFDLDVAGDDLAYLLTPDGPLQALASELELTFTLADREAGRGAHGWFRPGTCEVCVYTDASANSQSCTAVHEFAHALRHLDRLPDDPALTYAAEELVVESVAYSVLAVLGIDAGTSSVPYLASWSEQAPIETLERHAKLIDRLARRIEKHLLRAPDEAPPPAGATMVPSAAIA